MTINRVCKSSLLFAAAIGALSSAVRADVALTSFTPGDLVVLRTGDANNPDTLTTTTQVGVYMDEYTKSGSYVGTLAVPQTGANALTLPGTGDDQHQGVLNLSTNQQLLTLAGYNAAVGSTDANTLGGAVQPVIGVTNLTNATVNTTTPVASYGPGSASPYIRGAFTNDGNEFWTFGKYPSNGATSNGGLAYVSGSGPSATTTTVEGFADWRDIIAVNGQLYGGTGSSSVGNHGVYQVSVGEPTTNLGASMANNTQLGTETNSASAIALLDLSADSSTQNGLNVVYTISDSNNTIVKEYYNGTAWVATNGGTAVPVAAGNVSVNPTGLITSIDPSNPNWVDVTISGSNGFYTFVDESGYNGTVSLNNLNFVAAPAGEEFRGIAVAAVPEPTTIGLLALATVGMLGRRARRA